ncbi:P-loop containing nucleoside triphosphate hydrolase protein [Aspergillus spinulosporus]
MPSMSNSAVPQRRRREQDDDSADLASTSESSPVPTPASNSKRARIEAKDDSSEGASDPEFEGNGGNESAEDGFESASSTLDDGQNETQSQSHDPARSLSNMQNGVRSLEGFKPGAIVRIKVKDFVTYTAAEFFPGPKLNMVIGPNGTGKSTLVCAICLGLGWGPVHLGRAKDIGEFVKHGCREATIEIELARGPKHSRNPVVTRIIKREGNKSSFLLNGKQVSGHHVKKLAQSFAIQVDNLCQFLPQDKVSEFAALTPIELLHSTQRAAAGAEMVELHESLKKLRAEQKKLQSNNQSDRDLLANLENRQEMQRADFERVRQRAQIARRIELLQMVRPLVLYRHLVEQGKALKEERNVSQRELEVLEAQLKPVMRSSEQKKESCMQLEAVVKHKQRALERADKMATDLNRKVEQYEQNMKELDAEIEAEKKSAAKSRQEGVKIAQTIKTLARQLQDNPVEFDADWYNEQIRDKRREIREIENKAKEINERKRQLHEKFNETGDRLKQAEHQLRGLDSRAGRQERKLQDVSSDSHKAYRWLLNNQDKFEQEVFGPPIVTCSIKDPKYADQVESLLQKTDFTSFTVQNRRDFRTLQRYLINELRLHDISIRTSSTPLENLRSPLSDHELRDLGFQGWAKDFLDGPEPVVAMLVSEKLLHQTPVSLRDISDQTFATLEQGSISSWVAGKQNYTINRRREYGPGAISTRVRQVRPARVWTSQPVDASAKAELQRRIQELRSEAEAIKERIESDRATMAQLKRDNDTAQAERDKLERDKNDKQTAYTHFRAIPEKIRHLEAKKEAQDASIAKIRANIIEIRHKQDQLSVEKAEAVLQYANAVENLREMHEEMIKLSLWKIESFSDWEVLKLRNSEYEERLSAKRDEVKQLSEQVKQKALECRRAEQEAKKLSVKAREQPDLLEVAQEVSSNNLTPEALEGEIDSEQARLELTHGGPSNVVQEFEERARQINKLRRKLTEFDDKLKQFNDAIAEVRGKWEPKLDAIVKSVSDAFSDSFARIGCAGQVSLDKPGDEPGPDGQPSGNDFDQWSIQVHVKFREHENLSLLDSHRQSGGERAVSTIFYLMALQSLSASPFRVVDEINQGMDPRNERMVHGRLVEIACAPSSDGGGGQYFLITPKLLSGLVYKPGMRVLCIVSGEHMPEDHNLIDLGAAVRNKRALSARSGAGGAMSPAVRSVAA